MDEISEHGLTHEDKYRLLDEADNSFELSQKINSIIVICSR